MRILAALLVALLGCGHTPPRSPQPAPAAKTQAKPAKLRAAPPEPPRSATVGDAMADHFLIASWARDVVIAGAIDPLRAPLTALANYRYEDVPAGGWLRWMAQLQAAARLTASAQELDAAAMGVATMTRVCGECHRANEVVGRVAARVPRAEEPLEEGLSGRMLRHLWAATLLWEGLATPSDDAWQRGALELERAPAQLDSLLPPEFDAELRDVQTLGEQAGDATTLEQRADVYGLLLATCADCHDRWLEHAE